MKHFFPNKANHFLLVCFSLLFINSYAQKTHKLTYTKKSFVRESTIIHEDGQPKIDWFNSNDGIADSINKKIFNHIADFIYYEGYGNNQKN